MGRFLVILALMFLASCSSPEKAPEKNADYVQIPAGTYTLGYPGHHINPEHTTTVESFKISKTEVTNAQWQKFVNETGYKTTAERHHNAMTFYPGLEEFRWQPDTTANWRFPNGISRDGIADRMEHPVTCISFEDAIAYCDWAGVRLPTLDEWEIACRAGSSGPQFFDSSTMIYEYGNVWKGKDHKTVDEKEDFLYTAPVGSFEPNPWGLYDMYGNVFEFCSDRKDNFPKYANKVCARGGSWWCSENSCNFFNSVDIGSVNRKASFSNHGFRVVKE